ncbi:TPA: DsbA family protein [Candidatus Woesearchaeota archaeon]|nr:DsbA family protein [Candidatus Woesearchaeota archaeon]
MEEEHKTSHVEKSHDSEIFWKVTTVVLIAILAVFAFRGSNGVTGNVVGDQPSVAPEQQAPSVVKLDIGDDAVLGKKDAPVTIVEFSDYQCPFCGRFFEQTLPELKKNYVDTGKVKIVFKDFPLSFHPEAEPAAIAANCAGEQGKYYPFHDKVFANQESISADNYKKWARELGLNMANFEKCLQDPKQKEEIRKDLQEGTAAGVQGTPAFFVNGKLISGAQPYPVFQQLIDAELSN